MQKEEVEKIFGNRVRVRVCGLYVKEATVLLLKHQGVGEKGYLWAPPGGGLSFGESIENCLIREFKEEVNLSIHVHEFLFLHELVLPPLHAVELFFKVEVHQGLPVMGYDPEMPFEDQIIEDMKFWSIEEIKSEDPALFHSIFTSVSSLEELTEKRGEKIG